MKPSSVHHLFPYDPAHLGLSVDEWWSTQQRRWPLAAALRFRTAPSFVHVIGSASGRPMGQQIGVAAPASPALVVHRARWSGPRWRAWGHDWSRSLSLMLRRLSSNDLLVLHLNDYPAARLAQAKSHAPVLLVLHGDHAGSWDVLKRAAAGVVLLREDRLEALLREGATPEKLHLVTPSVGKEFFLAVKSAATGSSPRVGFVGRLNLSKGADTLAAVIEHFRIRGVPLHLDCIGTATEPTFRQLRQSLADAVEVRYHGEMPPDQVARLMATWDLLLFPSRTEGYGIAAAEALAAGTPVLAVQNVLPPRLAAHPSVHVVSRSEYPESVQRLLSCRLPTVTYEGPDHERAAAEWETIFTATDGSAAPTRSIMMVHAYRFLYFEPWAQHLRALKRHSRRAHAATRR